MAKFFKLARYGYKAWEVRRFREIGKTYRSNLARYARKSGQKATGPYSYKFLDGFKEFMKQEAKNQGLKP